MKRFSTLIHNGEDWLMARILKYAKQLDYTRYTSTLHEAWRLSISGLSASLLSIIQKEKDNLEIGPDEDFSDDPAASFGITEAQLHRRRGVSLGMFLRLMKYYRQSYKDLVNESEFDSEYKHRCAHIIERFFDRVEIGFCVEWAALEEKQQISELQTTNRSMTNEKNKYLTIFESLPNPVVMVDSSKRIENMNRSASLLFHKIGIPGAHYYRDSAGKQTDKLESTVSEPIGKLLPWLSEELDAFLAGKASEYDFEKRIGDASGEQTYHVNFSRNLDVSGKFGGTIIILDDITERKQAEAALQNSEARFRGFFEAATEGIAIHDVIYDENNRAVDYIIKDVNPAYSLHTGLVRREVVNKKGSDVYGVEKPPYFDTFKQVVEDRKPIQFETFFKPLDKHFRISVFSPQQDQFATVFEDISTRKKMEEKLRSITRNLQQNIKELKKANRQIIEQQKAVIEEERLKVLLQMAGATAHEMNQPLMTLLGSIELMDLDMADTQKLKGHMAHIKESGQRIAQIVKKIQTIRHDEIKPYVGNSTIVNLDQITNILSVESNDDDYAKIENILTDMGKVNLLRARDLAEAFDIIESNPIDLIFLDYLLPSGTGADFLLKMTSREIDLPVVIITGQGDEIIASQVIQAGAYDYLPKANISKKSLSRVIGNSIENYRLKKEVKMAMGKMAEMSTRDDLTGLYNRRYFIEVSEREIAKAQRYDNELVLCMLDLDYFKKVNDTHGHAAGDAVLKEVAELLQESVRKSDVPCRYGGEEFAVIMPNTHLDDGEKFCERLRIAVENHPISYNGSNLNVTVSIGLAQFTPAYDNSPTDLLEKADSALYLAKREGRNKVMSKIMDAPKKMRA